LENLFKDVILINLQGDIDGTNQITSFLITNTKITNNYSYIQISKSNIKRIHNKIIIKYAKYETVYAYETV